MRLLYLDWPHLAYRLEAARAQSASQPDGAGGAPLPELVVIGGQPWEEGAVLDSSPAARRLGVTLGQPLGSAHRLVPEACFLAADREAYRRAMEDALEALAAFTPGLEGETAPAAPRYGQVWLGIEGLHRLWGGEQLLAQRVLAVAASLLPGNPRMGIGNTRFGAQVAAVVGTTRSDGSVEAIPPGGAATEAAYLAPLSIRLLPADEEARERLRVFGLERIGEFAALARSAVVARFGAAGATLHDLARGMDGRPLRPRRLVARLRAEAELEPPVDTLEPLRFVLRNLCATLCEQLAARGAGATRAVLELGLEDARAGPLLLDQALPEPTAATDLLERLLLARLAATDIGAPVNRLTLELRGESVAAGQQLGLFAPQLARAARLDWQLAGLALRFGPERILRAHLLDVEAGVAEQRSEWLPASSGEAR
jgi:impB/mucB/samB family/impB/mucB/samB family C-terminal domain